MSLFESLRCSLDGVCEVAEKVFGAFLDRASHVVEAFTAIKEGRIGDAVDIALHAIASIKETLQAVEDTIHNCTTRAFEALTGIKIELPRLLEGVATLGRFLVDTVTGNIDIPVDKWLPVLGWVILSAFYFKSGNPNAGIHCFVCAFNALSEVKEQHPQETQQYQLPRELQNIHILPKYLHTTPEDLADLELE